MCRVWHMQEGKTQDKCLHCLLKRMDAQADCVTLSPEMSEDIKKIDRKAKIRVIKSKDGKFVIEMVELNHNHKMLESPGMLLHMRSHKKYDPLIDQLVKDMQLDNHTHARMMSTLSRMSGGLQYMGHTSRDWVNK